MAEIGGPSSTPKKTIVFVDDDQMLGEAVTEFLSASGYVVHTAKDGLEALLVIRKIKPDCIILDVVLPKLDGGQVCAAVRQDALLRNTPIIAFSSLSPNGFRFFPQLSADAYVAKGRLATALDNLLTAIRHLEEPKTEDAKGQALGYEHFESRRIVMELLRERQHLAAILRVLAPGALELDRECRIVMANPGACEFLGIREVDLIGEPFWALLPPENQEKTRALLDDLVQSEEARQLITAFSLDDKVVTVRLAPIREEGACTGLLLILEGEEAEAWKMP